MKKNGHRIIKVNPDSIAWEMGVEPGMYLVSVNGVDIEDVFDYQYLMDEEEIDVLIREENGEETLLEIEKDPDEDFGVEFENSLMDEYRSCCNHCIFCFIDQMPPGMRETLYFKDDDSRLSFLQGNYVTLTNMKDRDIDRIIRYHMEPINISVHTTNPELRRKMLGNRFAGDIFPKVQRLCDAGRNSIDRSAILPDTGRPCKAFRSYLSVSRNTDRVLRSLRLSTGNPPVKS